MPTPTTDKFANKIHGKHSTYSKGCRCEPCTVAHRLYTREKLRQYRRAKQGTGDPNPPLFIDATITREHLEHLQKHGMGVKTISQRTGINKMNLHRIRRGSQKLVAPSTQTRILNVLVSEYNDHEFIDATYTMGLVDEIIDAGYTLAEINDILGNKMRHQKVVTGKFVQYHKQQRIEKLHFALLRRPPKMLKPSIQKRLHSTK